jgi:hypothetical protein
MSPVSLTIGVPVPKSPASPKALNFRGAIDGARYG